MRGRDPSLLLRSTRVACGFGDLSLQPPKVVRGGQKRGTWPVAVTQAASSFHDPLRCVTGRLPAEVTVFSSRLDSLSWKPEYPHPWESSQADGSSLHRHQLLLDLAEPHPELAFRTPGFWEKSWMFLGWDSLLVPSGLLRPVVSLSRTLQKKAA